MMECLRQANVLVVDDEEAAHRIAAVNLRGHRLHHVYLGREALEILGQEPIDLVVLDLNLPDKNGFGVLERAEAVNRSAKVILITGHPELEFAVRALKHGAHDFMLKSAENYRALGAVAASIAIESKTGGVRTVAQTNGLVGLRDALVTHCIEAIVALEEDGASSLSASLKRAVVGCVLRALDSPPSREAMWPIVRRLPLEMREFSARCALRLLVNRTLASRAIGVSPRTLNRLV